jgi:hypothetical protein
MNVPLCGNPEIHSAHPVPAPPNYPAEHEMCPGVCRECIDLSSEEEE